VGRKDVLRGEKLEARKTLKNKGTSLTREEERAGRTPFVRHWGKVNGQGL